MPDLMDEIIRDAMRNGRFDNLPGEGKPLEVEDDSSVPAHLRMAHKLLKDNDLAPDWIMQGQAIDAEREQWRRQARRELRAYRGALADAGRSPSPEISRSRVQTRWEQTRAELAAQAEALNRQILSYNLKVPPGVTHKPQLDVSRELAVE
jgi:DnaJ family protein C protein 28